MIVDWERGLFWLWLAGAVGWVIAITYYIYGETKAFSLHMSMNEWTSFILLWSLPPIMTFGVYIFVLWFGRRMSSKDDKRWDRQDSQGAEKRFRRRG